jgi:hypothetical protein
MKRIFTLFFVTLFTVSVYAEAVYLKNGRVMIGRIVEKNQTYMVLKRGEGESAIKTTIFLEDIAKIESEQDFFSNIPITPAFLGQGEQPSLLTATDIPAAAVSGHYDSRARIKDLVEANQALAAEEEAKKSLAITPEPSEEMKEVAENPLGLKAFHVVEQMEHKMHQGLPVVTKTGLEPAAAPAGNGDISGEVRVPEAATVPANGGTRALYVYLLREKANGEFYFPVPMLYAIVPPAGVTRGKVSYAIKNIPAGRYKVAAEWDVADPMVQEQDAAGKMILNYLGSRGDYRGEYPSVVEIASGISAVYLNFDCLTLTQNNISFYDRQSQRSFQIKDIYLTSSSEGLLKFILVMENLGDQSLDPMVLDIFIDGAKSFFPLEIGALGAHQEKQFDITEYINFSQRKKKKTDEPSASAGLRAMTLEIRALGSQEVLFEKTLSVL